MITKKHSDRKPSVFECHKLQQELEATHGLYVVFEVRFLIYRLQVIGCAYTCGDKVGVAPRYRSLSTVAVSEARPLQTLLYWVLFDLWCQAQNSAAADEEHWSSTPTEDLPI